MRKKKIVCLILAVALLLSLCACAPAEKSSVGPTRTFTDSAGRTVQVPEEIRSVAPSGSYAQIMLWTLCPEKLCGLSTALSRIQKQYMDDSFQKLPVFGQFYGGSGTMNLEAVISAAPDIIIDMGEKKANIQEDMDGLQKQTGIPTVFIAADLNSMADAYDQLGDLLGEGERAGKLSAYIRQVLDLAAKNRATLTDGEKIRAMYAQGDNGLEVNAAGSIHAEVLDTVGAVNVADLGKTSGKGGTEVSIEQVLTWQPDVILLSPDANYDEIFTDPIWSGVKAVQKGRVSEVPIGPYNWLDRPPSVQRVLGVLWLGNLLYPNLYRYDMIDKTQEFFKLFYRCDLTAEDAKALLGNSAFREVNG